MAYASRLGRARISSSNPEAAGVCDRCGLVYSRSDLQWQFDYRGPVLQNLRILVCRTCLDTPQTQLKTIVVPADPIGIPQPRIQDYTLAETDYRSLSAPTVYDPVTGIPIPNTDQRVTQDASPRVTQPIGFPVGLDPDAVMPLTGTKHYGTVIPVLSVRSNGTDQITVTCSSPHGLTTNDQISIEGLTNNDATGIYSAVVATATVFTYQANTAIPTGSLLTSDTRVATALVGIPRGYSQIPLTGGPGNAAAPFIPLLTMDFVNGAYTVGGIVRTLGDCFEQDAALGPYSPTDVINGTGLTSTNAALGTNPKLTAFVTGTTGILNGFTAVATWVQPASAPNFFVSMFDQPSFAEMWSAYLSGNSLPLITAPQVSDYTHVSALAANPSAGVHKAAFTLRGGNLALSIDGNPIVWVVPSSGTPTSIAISAANSVGFALQSIAFYTPQINSALPGLSLS